jgi:hypothetical protein
MWNTLCGKHNAENDDEKGELAYNSKKKQTVKYLHSAVGSRRQKNKFLRLDTPAADGQPGETTLKCRQRKKQKANTGANLSTEGETQTSQ